jgi:hypothetical protein
MAVHSVGVSARPTGEEKARATRFAVNHTDRDPAENPENARIVFSLLE